VSTRTFALLLALCAIPTIATAGERDFSFSGFGFWVDESIFGEENGNLGFEHVWLIGEKHYDDRTKVVLILAPQGPEKMVHDLRVHHTIAGRYTGILDSITVVAGRFIPPMGREWSQVRIDRLPLVRYSGTTDSLVSRDNGFMGIMHTGGLRLTGALFAGEREGGYVKERENTHRHVYGRAAYHLPVGLSASAVYRWSTLDHKPIAFTFAYSSKRVSLEVETISVDNRTQWHALGHVRITRHTWCAVRHEHLIGEDRNMFGYEFKPIKAFRLKQNLVRVSQDNGDPSHLVLTQLVLNF